MGDRQDGNQKRQSCESDESSGSSSHGQKSQTWKRIQFRSMVFGDSGAHATRPTLWQRLLPKRQASASQRGHISQAGKSGVNLTSFTQEVFVLVRMRSGCKLNCAFKLICVSQDGRTQPQVGHGYSGKVSDNYSSIISSWTAC